MSAAHPVGAGGMSPLVLGTMTFGDTADAATSARILDIALESGVTSVDTANGYSGGRAEEILADLIRGRRDRIHLATKAGIPHPDAGDHAPLSAAGMRASLEGSLRRLGVDHIDLYYLHMPDRSTPIEETLAAVAEFVAEGKVGALGVSNFAAWQIAELNAAADALGAPRPVVAQQVYNLVARRLDEEYSEFAAVSGLKTVVYNPLAGGLLTGRHRLDRRPESGRFGDSRLAKMYTERYWDPRMFAAISALEDIAAGAGISLVELSLRWLLGREVVGSILLGGSKVEQLEANLAACAAGPLPGDVAAACEAVGAELRGPMPAYNR